MSLRFLARAYISYLIVGSIVVATALFVSSYRLSAGPFDHDVQFKFDETLEGTGWNSLDGEPMEFSYVDCLPGTYETWLQPIERPTPPEVEIDFVIEQYRRDLENFENGGQRFVGCDGHPNQSIWLLIAGVMALLPPLVFALFVWTKRGSNAQTR